MTPHDRLPISDVSHILNIPARTIRRWVTDGRLKAVTKGRSTYVSVSEVDALRKIIRGQVSHLAGIRNHTRAQLAHQSQNGP